MSLMTDKDSNYLRLFDADGNRLTLESFVGKYRLESTADLDRLLEATVDSRVVAGVRRLQTVLGNSLADVMTVFNRLNDADCKSKRS